MIHDFPLASCSGFEFSYILVVPETASEFPPDSIQLFTFAD
jgi:hypothetical protein